MGKKGFHYNGALFPFLTDDEISKRPLVFGNGINDCRYAVYTRINGKRVSCPFYSKWYGILQRIYYKRSKNISYEDCEIDPEWLLFSNFRRWMGSNDWEGKQLDKDLLVPGNKIYGPSYCIFVPQNINLLFVNRKRKRGKYPLGVNLHKQSGRFRARVNDGCGKAIHLGVYDTPEEAHEAWLHAKIKIAESICKSEKDQNVRQALLNYCDYLRNHSYKI